MPNFSSGNCSLTRSSFSLTFRTVSTVLASLCLITVRPTAGSPLKRVKIRWAWLPSRTSATSRRRTWRPLYDPSGISRASSTDSKKPTERIVYSVWPSFAMPAGWLMFSAWRRRTMSGKVMPTDWSFAGSTLTTTERSCPPERLTWATPPADSMIGATSFLSNVRSRTGSSIPVTPRMRIGNVFGSNLKTVGL